MKVALKVLIHKMKRVVLMFMLKMKTAVLMMTKHKMRIDNQRVIQ